ncbi:carbohydrate esterase family 3 protein [Hypoxylon sp. CI-4A]|nr:carbohydrate esterase family 3 protein [Hypoxylon sp. CI-4A]
MLATKSLFWCIVACVSQVATGLALPKPWTFNNNPLLPRHTDKAEAKGFGNGVSLRIMPLGASITYGYKSTDGNGYRKVLMERLVAYGNQVDMVGDHPNGTMKDNATEGWPSYVIDQVHEKAKTAVPEFKPNLILVNVGTNDCRDNASVGEAGGRLASMLDDLYVESAEATVILSTLIVNRDAATRRNVLDFNAQLKDVASSFRSDSKKNKRLVLVDMQADGGPTLDDLSDDGTHPTDAGYRKMADVWFDGIREADRQRYLQQAEAL